jgi:hypothetical protein
MRRRNLNENKTRQILAITIVGGFLLIVFLLFFVVIIGYMDVDIAKDLIDPLLTVFSGLVGVIIGYYFSQKKEG